MSFPALSAPKRKRVTMERFLGLQQVDVPAEGAFVRTENLSTRLFPLFAPRLPRRKIAQLEQPQTLAALNGLAWVDGDTLFFERKPVAELNAQEKPRQLVCMGAWLIVWPDGVKYHTLTGQVERLAQRNETEVRVVPCLPDGSETTVVTSAEAPENTDVLWLSTGETPNTLRRWNPAAAFWSAVPTACVRMEGAGIGHGLAAGDAVTVQGIPELDGSRLVELAGENFLVFSALVAEPMSGHAVVERALPKLDFVVEAGNRLWGCCSESNEILASKLGDPANWFCYAGSATDSYAATMGSEGPFTGAAVCQGYVLFFKEHCLHKVFGSKPSNFQITTTQCQGVRQGSAASLCAVNETLFYQSREGVCRYDGGLPTSCGEALGQARYRNGAAGSVNGRYYLSTQDETGEWQMFCYEPSRRLWCREDDLHALAVAEEFGKGYVLDVDGAVWELEAENAEETVHWMAETGELVSGEPGKQQLLSRVVLRLKLPKGSRFAVAAQFDGGAWRTLADWRAPTDQSRTVSLPLRRCDHVRLRLFGEGPCKLYALSREFRAGGEVKPHAILE